MLSLLYVTLCVLAENTPVAVLLINLLACSSQWTPGRDASRTRHAPRLNRIFSLTPVTGICGLGHLASCHLYVVCDRADALSPGWLRDVAQALANRRVS